MIRIKGSVWRGVPDAEGLQERLRIAKSDTASMLERSSAISYLTGAVKVLAKIEARQAVAAHIQQQIREIRRTLYYARGEAHEQDHR